jgi:hypothetical protein
VTASALACLILTAPGPVQATALSCDINLTILNNGSRRIAFELDRVQVRSHQNWVGWLPWRRASGGGWMGNSANPVHVLAPQQRLHDIYRPTGMCLGAREYRATITCLDGPRAGYSFRPTAQRGNSASAHDRNIVLAAGSSCR